MSDTGSKSQSALVASIPVAALLTAASIIIIGSADPGFLSTPPYWDSITGIFREAFWIQDHHWDLVSLFFSEPGYKHGGARTYGTSLYVYLIAVLYSLELPLPVIFITLHLLNLLLLFLIVLICAALLRDRTQSVIYSMVVALPLSICPLLLSQVSAINMEMAVTLSVTLCGYFISRERPGLALIALAVGTSVKHSAAIAGPAAAVVLLYGTFAWPRRLKWAVALCAISALVALLGHLERSIFFCGGTDGAFEFGALYSNFFERLSKGGLQSIQRDAASYFFFILIAAVIASCRIAYGFIRREALTSQSFRLCLFGSLLGFTFLVAASAYSVSLARYCVAVLPISYCGAIVAFDRFSGSLRYCIVVGLTLLLVVLGNSIAPDTRPSQNNGFLLERDLRYLAALRRDQFVAQTLEERYGDALIEASWPYSILLSEPRFGYVKSPLRVLSGIRPDSIKKLPQLQVAEHRWIRVADRNVFSKPTRCGVEEGEILSTSVSGKNELRVLWMYSDDAGCIFREIESRRSSCFAGGAQD